MVMSKKIRLLTSSASQDALHLAEQAVKRSSSTVKVDRQQLINLLIDHGVLCAAVGADNVDVPA
jgi:capsule polysaccharide export protein KpsE/RkpR